LAIVSYAGLLKESAKEESRQNRVRVGLYAGDLAVKHDRIVIAQITSGLTTNQVLERFAEMLDLRQRVVSIDDMASDIWTGTEDAKVAVGSVLFSSQLPTMRHLQIEGASMTDAYYMGFETWRNCMVTSPATDSTSLMLNMTPILEMEAVNFRD
jgi:hypothetical protein